MRMMARIASRVLDVDLKYWGDILFLQEVRCYFGVASNL
jgi:hypothetical protein